jgi:hypothetical protein
MKIHCPPVDRSLETKERTEMRVLEPREREGDEGDCF